MIIKTPHGNLETPFFMPDATRAVLKHLDFSDLKNTATQALVVNTYHLYLAPGMEVIKKAGGVHKFMNWNKPLLSDSGGFQVFSLIYGSGGKMGKVLPDKVIFKSPIDGSKHELTPEKSIAVQFDLGTDMMVCLDDVCPNDDDREQAETSVKRTVEWAERCRLEFDKQVEKRKIIQENKPKLFGVVQGGVFPDLREKCAKALVKIGFDGLGYGARPVDGQGNFLKEVLKVTAESIPDNYLKFALGVGLPEDIVNCHHLGWEMFDCVVPTREGRHGRLYADFKDPLRNKDFYKVININNAKFKNDFSAINPDSNIVELRDYSKAYLHHLFKVGEPLGERLASLNNLEFYNKLLVSLGK